MKQITARMDREMVPDSIISPHLPGKNSVIFLIILYSILLVNIPLFSVDQDLDSWFREDSRSEAYGELYNEMNTLIESAENLGIPVRLLMDKLREGSSKRVPAPRLLTAMEDEVMRLKTAGLILSELDTRFSSTSEKISFYRGISILLSGGFSTETIQRLIESSEKKENRIDCFLAAGHTLLGIQAVAQITPGDFERLGKALIESELPFQVYSTVISLFLKGMVQRLTSDTILEMIIDILNRGGGIVQMEKELIRRSSHR